MWLCHTQSTLVFMKATGNIPSHRNIHQQNQANSILFPVYKELDKLICPASLPAHSKRDLGWGKIPCQALICLPASTAIISHIISVTITSKSCSPRWGPHCYPINKHTAKSSALVAMEPGYWAWSKQIEKHSFSLLYWWWLPADKHRILGNWGQIL